MATTCLLPTIAFLGTSPKRKRAPAPRGRRGSIGSGKSPSRKGCRLTGVAGGAGGQSESERLQPVRRVDAGHGSSPRRVYAGLGRVGAALDPPSIRSLVVAHRLIRRRLDGGRRGGLLNVEGGDCLIPRRIGRGSALVLMVSALRGKGGRPATSARSAAGPRRHARGRPRRSGRRGRRSCRSSGEPQARRPRPKRPCSGPSQATS